MQTAPIPSQKSVSLYVENTWKGHGFGNSENTIVALINPS